MSAEPPVIEIDDPATADAIALFLRQASLCSYAGMTPAQVLAWLAEQVEAAANE